MFNSTQSHLIGTKISCGLLLSHLTVLRKISTYINDENQHNIYHFSNKLTQCNDPSSRFITKLIHSKLIKTNQVPFNLFLQNHLINAYFKCGDQTSAIQVFDEMPDRNVVSWTSLVTGFVKLGLAKNAISVFLSMHKLGFIPSEFTFVGILRACSSTLYLNNFPNQIYGLIIRFGFESNIFLLNVYLTSLIRHDQFPEAAKAFEMALDKDVVSWNTMFAGYLQFSKQEMLNFWRKMMISGIVPDNYTFASALTGLADIVDLRFGVQVHGQLVKSGHGIEMCIGNALVDMYLKNQDFTNGVRAFGEIPVRDVWSWTQMANGCLSCRQPNASLAVIKEMRKIGIEPNKFTLATMFTACANLASLEEGKKVHGLRIKLGEDIDVCVDNALLDMYAKCGSMSSALGVFKTMGEKSIISWTSMIMGYAQNGQANTAIEFFDKLVQEGIKPNYVTFISLLYACCQGGLVEEGWNYFSAMEKKYRISPGEDHYVCMVDLFGRVGRIKEAEELILSMPFKASEIVWKTLLGACQVHGDMATAKRAAKSALYLDREDPSTYVLVSNMLAGLNNWDGVGTLRGLMESREVKKMPASSWIDI